LKLYSIFIVTYSIKYNTFLVINQPFMISSIAWITNVTKSVFWNILVTERYNQQSIKFLFFNITTQFTSYYYTIKYLKLYSIFILQLFAFQYIITSIKSDTFNNITNGFCCQFSYFFVVVDILWLTQPILIRIANMVFERGFN
jgi:hypothetical protein